MKPKKTPQKDRQRDLFRAALSNIIDTRHGLVKLGKVVQWDRLDEIFGSTCCADNGRPGVSTRLMVALQANAFPAKPLFSRSPDEKSQGPYPQVKKLPWPSTSGYRKELPEAG